MRAPVVFETTAVGRAWLPQQRDSVKSLIKGVFIWLSIQLKIHVKILPQNLTKEVTIDKQGSLYEMLQKLNLKPDNIIILRGNTPVPVDDVLTEEQDLTIIQVASGG